MHFDTKVAIVVCDELPVWQRINAAAFLVSGVAGSYPESIGEPYEDGDGVRYLPMFVQPVLVFAGGRAEVRRAFDRARARDLTVSLFTSDLFATGHDEANRAAVKAVGTGELDVVGFALRANGKLVDKVLGKLRLHP